MKAYSGRRMASAGLMVGLVVAAAFHANAQTSIRLLQGVQARADRARETLPDTETPIAGFLARAVMVASDERSLDDLDWIAFPEYFGLTGTALAADPARDWAVVLLDSGAATDLVAYEDREVLGLTDEYLTDNPFGAAGVCGEIELYTSMPLGAYFCGLQDVAPDGTIDTAAVVGHSNFALGANTEDNALAGLEIPSVVGSGLFAQHVVSVRNSRPTVLEQGGTAVCSPAVEFMIDDSEINPLEYDHKFILTVLPAGDASVSYFGFPDLGTGEFFPFIPSTINLASALFFTADVVTVTEGTRSRADQFVVDTGAQATLISEVIAIGLGFDTAAPEFTVEVEGFGCTTNAPGFVVDTLMIPATGGDMTFTDVPVIVINIASPEGGNVPGIIGTNLFYDRDVVYVGNESTPYVRVSGRLDPLGFSRIAAAPADSIGFEWTSLPAFAESPVVLQSSPAPDGAPWTNIATNDNGLCRGTFEIPIEGATEMYYRAHLP